MNEPAAKTMVRFQAGLAAERARLVGGVHLVERGHADDLDEAADRQGLDAVLGLAAPERPEVLPKPRKNRLTFMPNHFAVAKCPSSCSMIENSSAATKMIQPISRLIVRSGRRLSYSVCPAVASSPGIESPAHRAPPGQLAGAVPGPAVGREHVGHPGDAAPGPPCSETTWATVSTIPVNGMRPAMNAPRTPR